MMAYETSEKSLDNFDNFIHRLQSKTKTSCLETWKDPKKII